MRRRAWWLPAVVSALTGGSARAAPIATLFNTGVDAAGVVLGGGATDPHWAVVSGPAGAAAAIAGDQSDGKWLAPDPVSEWISGGGTSPGGFDYRTSFSLAGFDPATASITGTVAADNEITDIRINGHSTGFRLGIVGYPSYTSFQQFNPLPVFSGDFVAGINTIDVLVYNDATGPQGVRLALTGSAQPLRVPEPASRAVLGAGLAALGLLRRRPRNASRLRAVPGVRPAGFAARMHGGHDLRRRQPEPRLIAGRRQPDGRRLAATPAPLP